MIVTVKLSNSHPHTQLKENFQLYFKANEYIVFSLGGSYIKDGNVFDFHAPVLNYSQKGQTQTSRLEAIEKTEILHSGARILHIYLFRTGAGGSGPGMRERVLTPNGDSRKGSKSILLWGWDQRQFSSSLGPPKQ